LKSLIFEALGLKKVKPKVARLRLDVCWLVPSLDGGPTAKKWID
jgi:hypothetical protein